MLIACCGAFQLAAAWGRIWGIAFFRNRTIGLVFGGLVVLGAFLWFFLSANRNVGDIVEGSQQFKLFLAAGFSSIVITFVVSSLVRHSDFQQNQTPSQLGYGVEALKKMTFSQAFTRSIRGMRRKR